MDKEIELLMEKEYTRKVYFYIFNILTKNGEKYTRNSNGVFFNLSEIKKETATEIRDYLSTIQNTMASHMEYLHKVDLSIG